MRKRKKKNKLKKEQRNGNIERQSEKGIIPTVVRMNAE